jgi:hypothetical protein
MAFDINGASWGFTPLLNKGLPIGGHNYFAELVVPIRFQDDSLGQTHGAIALVFTSASDSESRPGARLKGSRYEPGLWKGAYFVMASLPSMYGRRAVGIATDPSFC